MARAKEIRDLKIDEVSLVDKGANQHAKTVIAKRHDVEEESEVAKYFDEAGTLVDLDALNEGDVVFDEAGQAFEFTLDDEDDETAEVEEKVLEAVGKSAFHKAETETVTKGASLVDSVREELSKALTDADRDEVISKALGKVQEYEQIAKAAAETAQAERDLRLEREYTEIAKSYNVPVEPTKLGKVLKRLAEVLSLDEQKVIQKCLEATTASNDLYEEYGRRGGGDNADILSQVDAFIEGQVSKGDVSREELVSKTFEENPNAYDDYLAERSGR